MRVGLGFWGIECRLKREYLCQHNKARKVKAASDCVIRSHRSTFFSQQQAEATFIPSSERRSSSAVFALLLVQFKHNWNRSGGDVLLQGRLPVLCCERLTPKHLCFDKREMVQLGVKLFFFFLILQMMNRCLRFEGHTGSPFVVTWSPPDFLDVQSLTGPERQNQWIYHQLRMCLPPPLPPPP